MSSNQAKAYHSITIGDKNTWDDWHLVPTSRPFVVPPGLKTNYVDIPGGDGALDLTTALTGRPSYGNRTGSWEFLVMNDYWSWELTYSDILDYLHSQSYQVILDDDPNYYYEGRFAIEEWSSNKDWSTIKIQYSVFPYKMSVNTSNGENWLWDTFDFSSGIIQDFKDISVSGSTNISISVKKYAIVSEIIASASGMSVTWQGTTYDLNQGANSFSEIKMYSGLNQLTFNGTGTVTLAIREGRF